MKFLNTNTVLLLTMAFGMIGNAFGQLTFDPTINTSISTHLLNDEVVLPSSPIKSQILFIGGIDTVQTTATYGNAAGQAIAKQWHDFIGVTPDTLNDGEYWISVNHEMISTDSMIGDGGGMTVFKVSADAKGMMTVENQTLTDGRSGKFFNVDFVNTVGETGMNCGGINSGVDGRIWTAEEWFRTSNASLGGARDTADWTIATDLPGDINGKTVKKYQNFNWFVEIDPREAVAIRKQYNWGRLGYEGGAIADDNKTVYMGHDGTPGFFTKFVADVAGDFTEGTFYVYKQDDAARWVEIDNETFDNMLYLTDTAVSHGATIFNRLEWVAIDQHEIYRGSFKTASIRNISLTAPYMHNGGMKTLDEVMNFYNNGGGVGAGFNVPHQTLPPDALELNDIEIDAIINFMQSLTDTTNMTSTAKILPHFEDSINWNKRVTGGSY